MVSKYKKIIFEDLFTIYLTIQTFNKMPKFLIIVDRIVQEQRTLVVKAETADEALEIVNNFPRTNISPWIECDGVEEEEDDFVTYKDAIEAFVDGIVQS